MSTWSGRLLRNDRKVKLDNIDILSDDPYKYILHRPP